jgi:hypothetical protein
MLRLRRLRHGSRDGTRARVGALIAATRKSRIDRPCARRLSHTVSIRSTKRYPARLADPYELFLHRTAFRSALSAMSFVGSMPSMRPKVQSVEPYSRRSRAPVRGGAAGLLT